MLLLLDNFCFRQVSLTNKATLCRNTNHFENQCLSLHPNSRPPSKPLAPSTCKTAATIQNRQIAQMDRLCLMAGNRPLSLGSLATQTLEGINDN